MSLWILDDALGLERAVERLFAVLSFGAGCCWFAYVGWGIVVGGFGSAAGCSEDFFLEVGDA
jgi:hypothetical protein